MAVISKTDSENRPSTSKGPSKPAHTVGSDIYGSRLTIPWTQHGQPGTKFLSGPDYDQPGAIKNIDDNVVN